MGTSTSGRCAITLALAVALALAPARGALAEDHGPVTGDRGADMAVDLVVVRPLGLVGAVIGTAGFIIALPFTIPTGTVGETAREWIGDPLEYTFNRPLGEFERCGADLHPCGSRR
ncbi:hypothetical protein [Pseudothauera rhizosphaerae]|uniref:Multidrug transporter n=1 Tax=Pseudothauera rhizosphaerae TaxID=2565932 RepID=A0A4S4ADK6_9RHOO|nr:hypothetical protein [Pseudothauera rhizosphaerae]THF56842.1 hypothetical protein E6O51_18585 [Pseudothauera rhizosphaerae]